jgi:prepilin-type N-terminal cleavage/methylation domain-containing protein
MNQPRTIPRSRGCRTDYQSVLRESLRCGRSLTEPRHGFTLIELLTVVVIIGILASLVTAAAIRARTAAKNASVRLEISNLHQALEKYALEFGEYPPDFSDQSGVVRHVRRRFPQCTVTDWASFQTAVQSGRTGLSVANLNASTALVFWLDGIPDASGGKPNGFCADPQNPFAVGGPRTQRLFGFNEKRLTAAAGWPQYYPDYVDAAPLVYFRARVASAGSEYAGLSFAGPGSTGTAVPYRNSANTGWRNDNSFQIISCGFDDLFGAGTTTARCSQSGTGCTAGDYDNHTNFVKGSTIQDEMP